MKNLSFLRLALVSAVLVLSSGALLNRTMLTTQGASLPSLAAFTSVDAVALFGEKCAMCHNKHGEGLPNWRTKGQPDFTNADWQKTHTDAQIAAAIRNGEGKYMPAFKDRLSEEEIAALVGRVRGFAKKR
ncbi:MAG: c-type cytochrome [Acidobacteria bacterium]|nr:c-type cytochrome [Acidobacteriota bacterium]